MQTSAGLLAAGATLPTVPGLMTMTRGATAVAAQALPTGVTGESLAAQLFHSLSAPQRKVVWRPYDDPLRQRVEANWRITKPMSEVLSADQRDLVRQVFKSLHSEEYALTVLKQVEHDNHSNGGFSGCSVALFGEPGGDQPFEFVFTGRHVTRRCDGRFDDGVGFGGPIFYGHAAESFNEKPNHPGNIYWYQALRANELYKMLDGRQRKAALRDDPPAERGRKTVALRNTGGDIRGLPLTELSADQKTHAGLVLKDLLAPFRPADVAETLRLIEAGGGLDALRLSYFKNRDLGDDGVWDVWELEGPHLVWFFRGAPHVHTWVHIRGEKA